ncbi:MAG: ComEC family competence protein [Flavobacteriales bacterium]|nr:ComEC family competence protein [Flavobacteriales bacterium]
MQSWNSLPLFRLIFPLILGILLADYLYFNQLLIVNLSLLVLLLIIQSKRMSYRLRWVFGALAYLFVFGVGVWLKTISLDKNQDNFFANHLDDDSYLFIELLEDPSEKPNSYKTVAEVLSVNEQPSCGKILLYLHKELDSLSYGSQFITIKKPQHIKSPSNPYQFNYAEFLSHRNISHQLYLTKEDIVLVDDAAGHVILRWVISIRKQLLSKLNNSDLSEDGKAISSALLLGYKNDMNSSLKDSFSRSGVIHILAVSGLHVGIIYILLAALLSFMDKTIFLRWLKLFLVLLSLWLYAFITNLSPSVMRAATLFSFVAFGATINRNSNIYNTLAASAFILLFINPNYIYELGFQLSYLAVLGIVSIYPKIYSVLSFKFFLWDKIWQLIGVSIAAQIATFPLVVYYFHQFPNYFLLGNLLVLPLVPLIIYCGLSYLLFARFEILSEPILYALNYLIELLVLIVRKIESLPYSFTDFLWLSTFEMALVYLLIGIVLWSIYFRSFSVFTLSFVIVIALQISDWYEDEKRLNASELVFYAIDKQTAFGIVHQKEAFIFMDKDLLKNTASQKFNLHNHWSYLGLTTLEKMPLDTNLENALVWKKENHIQLGHLRLLWINDDFKIKTNQTPIDVDYCLISDYFPVEKLLQTYQPKRIVLDAALSYYEVQKLNKECQHLNVNSYSLKKDKALIVNLKN